MITTALYARVSSDKQVQENTIDSQVAALKDRINSDDLSIADAYQFIDNGYSGSNLIRPALEQLRDKIFSGVIDRLYIHSPDRLSRKYAYQMILLEEFERSSTEVIFLNHELSDNPESHLLLQMQGMIAEYERAKILERHRRGRIYAAKRGSVNVLSGAPYGYQYIDKNSGDGEASLKIIEEEAEVVRQIFHWVGRDRLSVGEVVRRLKDRNILTKKGKATWDRSTICYMLKNTTYKGQAGFGKKKNGPRLSYVRPRKDACEQPKQNVSRYAVEPENWIMIPVPAIIDETLFDSVQEQLIENKKRARVHKKGETYLLQGLLVCQQCDRAYCGAIRKRRSDKDPRYLFYRCTGTDSARFGGAKLCSNPQVNANAIELIVWEEVKKLLNNPERLSQEYQRRLTEINQSPADATYTLLEKKRLKLERGISLLIDSYTQQYILKDEFEPRIKAMRKNLTIIQSQQNQLMEQKNLADNVELIITNLEEFVGKIASNLNHLDWHGKRDIIRRVVKRVEVNKEDINIVYRVVGPAKQLNSMKTQHCCNHTLRS